MGHFLSGTVTFAKDVIGKKVVSLILLSSVLCFIITITII